MRFALDHLWQSSLFAASAWALTFALRRNHARARYVVWLAASVKFLIPFALLTAIGSAAHDRVPAPMASPPLALLNVVDAATVPFSSAHDVAGTVARTSEASGAGVIEWALFVMWLTGMLTLTTRWTARWVRLARVARRAAASTSSTDSRVLALSSRRALPVAFVETNCEPGVFGIVRPVLLWPVGVSERLSDEQVESIVAHELCHVRWRDNASAALHMIVEALFWFHPLVWWIGARLVDERERACDEDVLRAGRAAQDYAEGILTICEFQLASPLACVAGVTGSDLRRRITDIMRRHTGETLHGAKRSLLAAVAVVTIAAPIGVATWRGQAGPLAIAPVARERTFDAASIKQNKNGTFGPQGRTVMSLLAPGERVRFVNVPLRQLVVSAYPGYTALQGPDWIGAPGPPSDKIPRFDVEARAAAVATHEELQMMLRALLADRFKLVLHAETKDENVYALRLARSDGKLGPALRPEAKDCESFRAPLRGTGASDPCPVDPQATRIDLGHHMARSRTLDFLATIMRIDLDRPVVNKTGLDGSYDWELKWMPRRFLEPGAVPLPGVDADAPSMFTAVQEQLGLKLAPEKDGQPFLVVDHVELPSEN